MHRWLKAGARAIVERLGYDVRHSDADRWGVDAFRDQARLLAGGDVRVIIDGGANIGDSVALYRARFPAATIYAFEPFPAAHARLVRRYAGVPAIRPVAKALSDETGTRAFYANDIDVTNSLLPLHAGAAARAAAGDPAKTARLDVPTIALDRFCADEGLERIDVLKLDVQGGEGLALRGAAGLLARRAVRVIYTEVLFARLYDGQASFGDLAALLDAHGYQLFGLYNLDHGAGGLGWGDAIFRPA